MATPEVAAAGTRRAERYRRFTVSDRVEHWVQMATFVGLALTGLPQRYSGAGLSQWSIDVMGGIEMVRIAHRVLATILMLAVVYHFMSVGYRKFVLREPRYMVPGMEDLRAVGQSVGHALGLRASPPKQGRFTWEEKAEYWALVWGTVVMIITGFLLWNPIATTMILPGQFVPAAKAAHSGEALLAVLAVIVWHVYHVHVKHLNTAMFTGYMSRAEMERFHALELEAIESGVPRRETDSAVIRERAKRFFPVFGVFAAIMLLGIYFFISFENTAIETIVPPEQVEAFAPVETTSTTTGTTQPATTTTVPSGGAAWETVAALFDPACTSCHGVGLQSGGLSLASYEAALAGGVAGPGVVPGDPEASVIVQVMEAGGHPAVLSAEGLAALRAWVAAGAPGPVGPPTTIPGGAASDVGWQDTVAAFFSPSCTVCHGGDLRSGGLSLASYEAALAGGSRGAGVVPGDPEASVIVQIMEADGHPAMLTAAQLATLREWIAAGAPEVAGSTTTTAAEAGTAAWEGAIAALFHPACTSCHGTGVQSGGLSLASYEAALAGGVAGPGVVPGDPAASVIVQVMEAGGHPAVLSAEDLAVLREWIAAGAPSG